MRIDIADIVCRFGEVRALDQVSLTIRSGEFLVVLGASGCGKTTLLRVIAGFHRPQSGSVRIGAEMVSGPGRFVPPEQRELGIVFQSYALWPHMSVVGNVGFGLDRLGRVERRDRVAQALRQVGLDGHGSRRPAELSGGQRQRVALARCLAKSPGIVLLDEPLANLDPALRGSVQREFVAMHARLRSTFVYVTHDQTEALALADRIALLEHGRILQCDTPRTIYECPAGAAVARFMGNAVLLAGHQIADETGGRAPVGFAGTEWLLRAPAARRSGPATLCVRAHDLALEPAALVGTLGAAVLDARYQGSHWLVRVVLDAVPATPLDIVHRGEPPGGGARVGVRILDGWVLPDAG